MTAEGTLLYIDAIEGENARLLLGTEAFNVPARLLPPGAREGNWTRWSVSLVPDPPEGDGAKRSFERQDDGGDIKL